jgi:hypothetical protein
MEEKEAIDFSPNSHEDQIQQKQSNRNKSKLNKNELDLDSAYLEWEKINQLILKEKETQKQLKNKIHEYTDASMQLNRKSFELKKETRLKSSHSEKEDSSYTEKAQMRKLRLQMIKNNSMLMVLFIGGYGVDSSIKEQSSSLIKDNLNRDNIKDEYFTPIMQPSSLRELYQNEEMARNKLRTVLDRMANKIAVETQKSEDKMFIDLYFATKDSSNNKNSFKEKNNLTPEVPENFITESFSRFQTRK